MTNRFTAEELTELADLVAAKVAAKLPPHPCPFGPDEQAVLSGFAAGVRSARKTALATVVGFLVLGGLSFLGWSVLKWLDVRIGTPAGGGIPAP